MRHLKHPATIIAAVALFLAAGGGAAAYASGLISGSQIKNHSIAVKKLTKSAIKSLRGQRGARGSKGATGATGAAGATGTQGPPGPDFERLAAQTHTSTGGGTSVDFSTHPTINTVSFTAPAAGFVTVWGQAFVNSEGLTGAYELVPQLDGANMSGAGFAADHATAGGELFTLNFNISLPVSAGSHTVKDIIEGPGGGNSFYNANNLTVLFAPTGGVTGAASRSDSASQAGR